MAENDLQLQLLERIAASLEELVSLSKMLSYSATRQVLETILDTEEKRLVYHLMDGERTAKAIEELSGVNTRYFSEWGQTWEELGIAEPAIRPGRRSGRQKSFDLAKFGIPIPEVIAKE